MDIKKDVSLKEHNTFGIDVSTRFYAKVYSKDELQNLLTQDVFTDHQHLILGGGSNLLFTKNFDGIVIHMANRGIEILDTASLHDVSAECKIAEDKVFVRVQAGEPWDDVVAYCVNRNWGGLENLSLIPGQTGSSPIQNIGAYGVELKDCFYSLEAIEKSTGKPVKFSKKACHFGYRDSYFKQKGRNRYIIVNVTFCLNKNNHSLLTSYGSLSNELQKAQLEKPTISDVRNTVIAIRNSKLPDHTVIGNAGSFFKNPTISHEKFHGIKEKHPDVVGFINTQGVKLAAGWLIEKTGWKGYRENDAGVHHQQALVLVNHGNANGADIIRLAERISDSVMKNFNIQLEPEVNII